MLVVSVIIYLIFSLILYPRFFEKVTFSKITVVFFLCTFSLNVLVSEILSLLHLLNHPWLFLGIQTLIIVILTIFINRWSPLTTENIKSFYKIPNFHFTKFEVILLIFISAIFFGFFIVGISTPINNMDSLATHLPRIFYWLQHDSFDYWTTTNMSQLTYPINGLIQGLWLFLLGNSEYLFFLVQWFSLLIITLSIFEISKFLGFSSSQALLCGLIGLSLPVILLQMFSFQGDLTVTALVMVVIVFFFEYLQTRKLRLLFAACFSIILALGTKQTAFFLLPLIGIVILCILILHKNFKAFWKASWLLLVLVVVFSSYQFIQNMMRTGSPFGMDSLLIEEYSSATQVTQKAVYVIPRFAYQFIGVDGLPRSIQPVLVKAKEKLFTGLLNPLGLDLEKEVFLQPGFNENESFRFNTIPKLSEDMAWFGPFGFLLIPAAIALSLFSKNKLRRNYVLVCFINFIIYLFFVFIQRPGWDPYQGRYFILALFPFIPLISMLIPKNKIIRGTLLGILLPISFVLILNTFFFNDSKPIITAKTQNDIINNSISPLPENTRLQIFIKKSLLKIAYPTEYSNPLVNIYEATYYDRLFYSNMYTSIDVDFINHYIPEGESLSFMIARSPLEYALFGKNRSRSIYPITEMDQVSSGYFLANNFVKIPDSMEMNLVGKNEGYSIYFIGTK